MLVLKFSAEATLMDRSADGGFITWIDVTIQVNDPNVEVGRTEIEIGSGRLAMVHVAEAFNQGESLEDILDADSQEIYDLYEVFFKGRTLREPYENGDGMDVLYVADLELAAEWHDRLIEEAVVRRTIETWGGGCAIAVLPVNDLAEAHRWEAAGFGLMALAPKAQSSGYVAMDLSMKHPRIVEADAEGHRFRIEPADD